KNPSITLIQAIAQALECNIEELIDGDTISQVHGDHTRGSASVSSQSRISHIETKDWNQDLYLKCFNMVYAITNSHKINMEKG
ncbi:hypothetical protein ABTQ07_21910, partial [Acinetobacter baumannii]